MNNQAIATSPGAQEVVCDHKPGDVWADGCCTSKKNQKVTNDEAASSASLSTESIDQSTESIDQSTESIDQSTESIDQSTETEKLTV